MWSQRVYITWRSDFRFLSLYRTLTFVCRRWDDMSLPESIPRQSGTNRPKFSQSFLSTSRQRNRHVVSGLILNKTTGYNHWFLRFDSSFSTRSRDVRCLMITNSFLWRPFRIPLPSYQDAVVWGVNGEEGGRVRSLLFLLSSTLIEAQKTDHSHRCRKGRRKGS